MSRGRMRFIDSEPAAVGCDVVAELLERIGWENSASLVRRLGQHDAAAFREAEKWRQAFCRMQERYEPAEPSEPLRDFRPPAEASD